MDDYPLRERWQPTRGGLINLFKYENQIFRYENGRLLLRGNNGSGKSRVLALQLPFLLDGEISPYRVEPDRDPAKRMEWHLLMDIHERRSGYTWIEFGRSENGETKYLTLGCGMEARKGSGAPHRWFFITPQRIGIDLELTELRTPLTKRQLATKFETSEGTVYERTGEYRSAADDHLFKLGNRYAPLIDLLIQLRQPQLMRDMKEDVLSNALSEALPPVGENIIKEVAESFEGLESDRQHTEGFREMLDTVENFRSGYSQYLAVAIRRLCKVVREGHSQYEVASRHLREIDQKLTSTRDTLTSAQAQSETFTIELATLQAEIQTLRDSPEMRSKRNLDEANKRAAQCEEQSREAQKDLESAKQAHKNAVSEREQRRAKVDSCKADTERKHRALTSLYEIITFDDKPLFDLQSAELQTEQEQIEDLISNRKKSVKHLRQRNDEIAAKQQEHQRNTEDRDRSLSSVAESEEKVRITEGNLDEAIVKFGDQVSAWHSKLKILTFPQSNDWIEALSRWLEEQETEFSFRIEVAHQRDIVYGELTTNRAMFESERAGLKQEHSEVCAEINELNQGRQPEPPACHTRAERPDDRPGAPFWKRFEFRDEIPLAERAGWEAALESAGLLDAWIFPDGSIDTLTDDDFLTAGEEMESAKSLAAILKPAEVSEPLHALLRCIGNHRDSAPCWIDLDGHWANGPHHGNWSKPNAEYLGHRAREESRQRRITELESLCIDIEAELSALATEIQTINAHLSTLEEEIKTAPTERQALDFSNRLTLQRETLQEAKTRHIEAEKRALTSARNLEKGIARRNSDADDMGLAEWGAPEALAEFAEKLDNFEKRSWKFWPAWKSLLGAQSEFDLAMNRETEAADACTQRHAIHQSKRTLGQQERARYDTLLASVGASVQELMARLQAAESKASVKDAELDTVKKKRQNARIEEASLIAQQASATEKRAAEEGRRNEAVGRMELFAEEQLFAEIDPGYQPDRVGFSPSAAVDLARRLEQELKEDGHDLDRWNKLQSEITQSFIELSDQLGRHGHHPQLRSIDDGSVNVIACDFRGESRTIRQLAGLVSAELEDRKRIFEEREREVIENHLIGEAANELQKRIRDGEEWVVKVNEELGEVATSSGIQLKFSWDIASPDDDTLKSVRGLFLKTSAAWTPRERDIISQFLQNRIRAEREQDDTVTWREQLSRALDYRSWHRFGILRRSGQDDSWKKLTKKTFGTGSGGEKAMTLTVPQFAAAAAHYKSAHPHAPRLILLDEVFVGIDSATRTRLMGLLETFDLDYVMTSEREWGVYPTVSALAIYQLATRKGLNAIAVTRWVWNGKEKVRDDRDED